MNQRTQVTQAAPVADMRSIIGAPLVVRLAQKMGVAPEGMLTTLLATSFRPAKGNAAAAITREQVIALLQVADQYGLNLFTRELFAFPDKNGNIVPVVSIDGWNRLANENPQYDGLEFRESPVSTVPEKGKTCPEWIEAVIYRKDRSRPIVIREYLDEVYVPPRSGTNRDTGVPYEVAGPWQSHTKRMLRHKALIQGLRVAFGFAGIYDEDEAGRILDAVQTESRTYAVPERPPMDRPTQDVRPVTLADKVASMAAGKAPQKEPEPEGPGPTPDPEEPMTA